MSDTPRFLILEQLYHLYHCPVFPGQLCLSILIQNNIPTAKKQGRRLDLRSQITVNLDETEVEAEVSTLEDTITLKSNRGLNMKKR
jgi:hypothetical protein